MGQTQQKRRAVLIVEDDTELRRLTAALLEDEQVNTIECESAEAALAVMLIGGREVAMIFADVRLPGAMDGVDLAWEVKQRWPLLPVILTSGLPRERIGELPLGVRYMPKPVAAAQRTDRRGTGVCVCARRLISAIDQSRVDLLRPARVFAIFARAGSPRFFCRNGSRASAATCGAS
jgi:CheY-like chemotaxis protein